LGFQADKQTIANFVKKLNTHDSKEILNKMEELDEEYRHGKVAEVSNATQLVEE